MLLFYLYCLGARRWQCWMPFQPPFSTAGKQFIKNTSSHRIYSIKQLFYWFIQNQAQALLPSPSQRGSLHWIRQIYTSHAVRVANGSPLWWCLLLSCAGGRWYFPYYSYRRKATEQEFFVPTQILIGVILLKRSDLWIADSGASNHVTFSDIGCRKKRIATGLTHGIVSESVLLKYELDLPCIHYDKDGTQVGEVLITEVGHLPEGNFILLCLTRCWGYIIS